MSKGFDQVLEDLKAERDRTNKNLVNGDGNPHLLRDRLFELEDRIEEVKERKSMYEGDPEYKPVNTVNTKPL